MATAKQLAARKKFAEMARSGELARKRTKAVSRKKNPLTRVKVNSPSMSTGEKPTKRLKARRKNTEKAPAGYYANPKNRKIPVGQSRELHTYGDTVYIVEISEDKRHWEFVCARSSFKGAEKRAEYMAEEYPNHYVRVINAKVGA